MANKATVFYRVRDVIRVVRSQRVILDSDLAKLYGVPTKRLNEAVKRNIARFPRDFMFQLKQVEGAELRAKRTAAYDVDEACSRSQIATLNAQDVDGEGITEVSPSARRGRNVKYLPYAFTEHGAIMAAMVLNSPKATEMSVFIVRTFMKMREQMLSTAVHARQLAEMEKKLLTHDAALIDLYEQIQPLLVPPPEPERKRIGFNVCEEKQPYHTGTGKKHRTKKTQG